MTEATTILTRAGWLEAKMQISQIIQQEFMYRKQRTRTKVARFKEAVSHIEPSATEPLEV